MILGLCLEILTVLSLLKIGWGGVESANSNMHDFISCATMLGLDDVFSVSSRFTWSNGTHWAKLDRVLVNSNWNALNLDCQAEFLPYNSLSDHTPFVVSLSPHTPTRNKPFRFLNMWMTHPAFLNTVRETWQEPVYGTKQYRFCKKLKALKSPLKTLNRQDFSHISERAKRAHVNFVEAQNMLMNDPTSNDLKAKVKESRRAANFLLEAEIQFLNQTLKNRHLI